MEAVGVEIPGGLYTLAEGRPLSIAIVSLLLLGIIAIVAVPIMIRVIGEAGRRDTSGEEDENPENRDPHSGPGRD